MMNRETAEYLVGLGKEQVVIEANNGGQYTPERLVRITEPVATAVEVHTLTAVVDYIKENIDNIGPVVINVKTPTKVKVMSPLNGDRNREHYLEATAITLDNLRFDTFLDTERFNIMMQAGFVNHPVQVDEQVLDYKKMLLQVTGLVREEAIKEVGDDGVSQAATIKTGVASVGEVVVPNPVQLAPYRTFSEIEQPLSRFVFRMKSGPSAALYEADGGAWKNEAILKIKEYLKNELSGIKGVHILA